VIGMCDWRSMTTTSIQQLESQIERLVREHMAACEVAAAAAVQRAFNSAQAPRPKTTKRATSKTVDQRRSPEEVAELSERFYAAVCETPGESMRVIAAQIGATRRELERPVVLLKRAGRVRTAGQRQFTRYFPMAAPSPETT
jgi:hypothetical protein